MIARTGIGPAGDPECVRAVVIRKRQRRCAADRFHARERGELRQKAIEKLLLLFRVRIFPARQNEIRRQHPARIEPRIGRAQVGEAFHEQTRARQQEQRKRDLGDDENAAHPLRFRSGPGAISLLQRGAHVRPRHLQRGDEGEEERAPDGRGKGEEDDRAIDPDFAQPGQILRTEAAQEIDAPPGQKQAAESA